MEFSQVDYVRIAIKSKKCEIVKTVPVADIDEGNATITLTQEETASLGSGQVAIQ